MIFFRSISSVIRVLLLGVAVGVGFVPCGRAVEVEAPAGYQIRFGTLRSDKGEEYPFDKEATVLVRKTKEPALVFGFEITPPDNAAYSYCFFLKPPAPVKQVGGDLKKVEAKGPLLAVTSGEETVPGGKFTYPLWFDADDPLGEWQIEIFVNGKTVKTFKFKVVAE